MAGRRRSDPLPDMSSSGGTTSDGVGVRSPEAVVWIGEVTWREVAGLREQLFDQMDTRTDGVSLDVRRVKHSLHAGQVASGHAQAAARGNVLVHRWAGAIHDVPLQWPDLVAGFIDTVAQSGRPADSSASGGGA